MVAPAPPAPIPPPVVVEELAPAPERMLVTVRWGREADMVMMGLVGVGSGRGSYELDSAFNISGFVK